MPVYNGLTYVLETVESVLEHTQDVLYRLIILDHGSDRETAHALDGFAREYAEIEIIRSVTTLGFMHSCLRGYECADAPFLVLLNSGVVVTPEWLRRLLRCATSNDRIASVNPLANHTYQLASPIFPGANFLGMNELASKLTPTYPDLATGSDFCMLLRRSALEQIGFLKTTFEHDDCADFELSIRLKRQGYRTVLADDVYVYYQDHGSLSYQRCLRRRTNHLAIDKQFSMARWWRFLRLQTADPTTNIKTLVRSKTRWDPMPVIWETGRATLTALRQIRPMRAAGMAIDGLVALPQSRTPKVEPLPLNTVTRHGRLRVTYILERLVVAGGVLSVIQIVNRLIRLGVEARIATLFEDPAIHRWTRLYTRPMVFRSARELVNTFPPSDIVVATLWTTAPWARAILDAGRAAVGVYFVQDYEPWFFPANNPAMRDRVRATFSLLDHRIVKSDWLAGMLREDGHDTHKISLGMDLGQFYPRDTGRRQPTLVAMARPLTPRRGFRATIDAIARVKAVRSDVEIHLFGDRTLHRQTIPFNYHDEGVITNQNHLAEIYSLADVFLDGSEFQGFGRCGLEAMACGAACVLTEVGGVNEYARHNENALLTPPQAPEHFAEAILSLLQTPARRAELIAAGHETAKQFCHYREGRETLRYFESLMPA